MPGIVKAFIESLAPFKDRPDNPPLGFLVQSGFPEAAHSRFVERYLQKLAQRLGSPYLGTIVKGGAEGTRIMPENMTHDLFAALEQLGRGFRPDRPARPRLAGGPGQTRALPGLYGAGIQDLRQAACGLFLLGWSAEKERRLRAALRPTVSVNQV